MLKQIEFICTFGMERKKVNISRPSGGPDGYHVYINNYYQGIVSLRNGEWVGHFNPKSELTSADIFIIGDIIENGY